MEHRAPEVETPRLRLRGHRADDLDARTAITSDPDVVRYVGGVPQTREDNWARLRRYAGHWALLGWGLFAIEDKASGRLIGEAGLGRFERGLGSDFDSCPEAAWIFATAASGQGLAYEAMGAALAWHERRFGPTRVVCIIAPENARSLRLAARLGFTAWREGVYNDRAVILHERTPPLPSGAEAR